MKPFNLFKPMRAGLLAVPALTLCLNSQVLAQAPSSLSYPTPSVFIANVSNVFLSPNLAGSTTGYSITPALPAGLSFNTNTGVISGIPTGASAATTYTITANGSTSTSTTASIQVTNNYFDNNYNTIKFGGSGVTVINGSTGAAIDNTTTNTHGRNPGEVVVYRNVAILSGQAIDCIVKTVSTSGISSWSAYDQASNSGSGYTNNDSAFFSPQISFANGTASAPGGTVVFNFQFILGGTYNTTTQTGLPVVLQNVRINTYDIDGNGNSYSNQINEFGGFSTSAVGSNTTLQAPTFNAATNLTTYRSSIETNSTNATSDNTRVRLSYDNISDFSIRMGGGGTCYFFLDFSAGPAFSTAVSTPTPSVDLNTNLIGVNNAGSGCGSMLSFTPSGQTNITPTNGNLSQLTVSFPTAEITDAANEQLIVNGATNGTFTLNGNPSVNNMSFNGNTYSVNGSVTSGVRTLVFTRNSGTLTVANAEAILDSLRYNNTDATPTSGSRNFTVNVRNTAFESPDAVFTATLNCVSISGNVFHDVNAMVDNTVNATGSSQFAANGAYVVLVNPSNNQVIDVRAIAAGGAYNFGTVTPGSYALYVSNAAVAAGTTFTAATFPTNYVATSENLGAAAGNDHLTDGKLLITIGSASITNANFGLQIPPVTTNNTINNIANPGGFNGYTLPGNAFPATDADGVIDSVVINSFPTGANYLKVGTTVYTATGICPPQSTCTAWPGSVVIPFSGGSPVPAIQVDPAQEGNTSVVIDFAAWDNGRALSNASTLTINFIGTAYHTISGKVWNDINGNGQQTAGENNVAPADAGQALYAMLIQQNHTYSGVPTILAVTPVNASTGYSFSNVPEGNDYFIRIASAATIPVAGAAASTVTPHLAEGWTGVSTNADGTVTGNLNTANPTITIPNLNTNIINQNFGIERLPEATDATTTVPYPSVGTLYTLSGTSGNPPVPSATDAEDGPLGAGKTIVITTLPQFTTLLYDNTPVTGNQVIASFDPSKLKVQVTINTIGKSGTSFQFSYQDAAGKPDPSPATYALTWGTPLPVTMGTFKATIEGAEVRLDWTTFSEENNLGFAVERSNDSRNWQQIGFVPSAAENGNSTRELDYTAYDAAPLTGMNYYRLKQTDIDNKVTYSEIRHVVFDKDNSISIYPNPTTDMLHINAADQSKIAEVRILDINGRIVFQDKKAENGISLGKLARGTYMLQVEQTNGNVASFKIVKQ